MNAKTSAAKPAAQTNENVTLTDNSNGKQVVLPLVSGTVGPKVIDIRHLYT